MTAAGEGSAPGCRRFQAGAPAPLAIVNGRVFTADPGRRWAAAAGMKGGLIAAVGSARDVREAVPDAEVIDARGRTVLPGLIDALQGG